MDSVFQEEKYCYYSLDTTGLEMHHIFGGGRRKISEKYGLKVWLRWDVHRKLTDGKLKDFDMYLKQMAQMHYEGNIGTREEFIKDFGRSYL